MIILVEKPNDRTLILEKKKSIEGIVTRPWKTYQHVDSVNITMLNESLYDIEDNTTMIGDNGAFGGLFQSEDYIIDRKSDIYKWFEIKEESSKLYNEKLIEIGVVLDDNLCVINFRGGEYRGIPNVLLRREYWKDSINYMLSNE
jgi:hypothetical protein